MALRADDVDLGRDRDLVVRSQAGDEGAFEDLYRRYFRRLYRYCLRRVGDPHEAEELTQEAFTRAYRALPRLAGERRFYPWLSVIASRLCADEFRRRARSEPAAVIDLGVIEGGQERVFQAVDEELVTRALSRLTPRHQEVLALRERDGWSYQHIAEHMEVSLGTVEALLHRARRSLKREFDALAGPDMAPAVVGAPAAGWLARRLAGLRARLRVDEWVGAGWAPAMGNLVAATMVVAGSTVVVAAGAAEPVEVRMAPAAAVYDMDDAGAGAAAGAGSAPVVVGPAAGGTASSAPARADLVVGGRATRSTPGDVDVAGQVVTTPDRIDDDEAAGRADDMEHTHQNDHVTAGVDPAVVVEDANAAVEGYRKQIEKGSL